MDKGWWLIRAVEALAISVAIIFTAALYYIPTGYDPKKPGEIGEDFFTDEDKKNPGRSGYGYFLEHKHTNGKLRKIPCVQVVVLGDIGRSPRMQYHALSLAHNGGFVSLIGYNESEVHPDIQAHRFIDVVPIPPSPKWLQTSNKILFLLLAPLKVFWQTFRLYFTLATSEPPCKFMLVQNPPSIPTLAVVSVVSFMRRTQLALDWHNFGYSLLALKLGPRHLFVRLAKLYEWWYSRDIAVHFAVTDAMTRVLERAWNIEATTFRDRPSKDFQPINLEKRAKFLRRLPETKEHARDLENKSWRLVVSSTSWTADEDFSLFLDGLVAYSAAVESELKLPKILAIITGKGPQKEHYKSRIQTLNQENKLNHIIIKTTWLSTEDYALLLGSADLGVSLHTSSSGVDFPMKVVDMFGAGLPVAGWSKFEAWSELVVDGKNGSSFESAKGLTDALKKLFGGDGEKLRQLRQGALEESKKRWDDDWLATVGLKLGVLIPEKLPSLPAGFKSAAMQ